MKRGIGIALVLAGCIWGLPAVGQQANGGAANQQNRPAPPAPQPRQKDANPFPTDMSDVPVMPSRENPNPGGMPSPTADDNIGVSHYSLPGNDADPVASPDQPVGLQSGPGSGAQTSSSNVQSLDSILPQPVEPGKNGSDNIEVMPKETAAQDKSVGKYYLDNKNWRAALSRYQSALVLAPEDPDVYWGLAVSQKNLGDYAAARANYVKVIEYDPGSKHAKEARKALKEPELANAGSANQARQ
jgi:tetratricopeptide (TPR) repeat protein